MLQTYQYNRGHNSRSQKEALSFVKQKLDSARWFIDAITAKAKYPAGHHECHYQLPAGIFYYRR